MGGMAAQIPVKTNPDNEAAMNKVDEDKLREVLAGCDGTWVAHPGLVARAKAIFNKYMKTPNQIHVLRKDVVVTQKELLAMPNGHITEAGIRKNMNVGILYLEAWLRGVGCVPLYCLMEDAATVEISRTQLWQWLRHSAQLSDGRRVSSDLMHKFLQEEIDKIVAVAKPENKQNILHAAQLLRAIIFTTQFVDFLTLPAYRNLKDKFQQKAA